MILFRIFVVKKDILHVMAAATRPGSCYMCWQLLHVLAVAVHGHILTTQPGSLPKCSTSSDLDLLLIKYHPTKAALEMFYT